MGKQKYGFRARAARFFQLVWCGADLDDGSRASTIIDDDSTLVAFDAVCHIKRLPDRVLDTIFTTSKRAVQDAPVERVVSHVAARWRTIALSNPDLWATIELHPEHQRALLKWYLANSAGRPLDIRLGLSQESWDSGAGRLLLADVLAEAPCLRRLAIRADFPGADAAVRAMCQRVCAPRLEHLSFIVLELEHLARTCLEYPQTDLDAIVDEDFSPVVFTGGAPRLAVVRLQHVERALFPPLGGVTTLHLEEYTCPRMTYSRFRALLHALPALANLSIYGDLVASWPSTADVTLPQLRSLRSASNAQAGRMLLALDARALTSLFLKDVRDTALAPLWAGLASAEEPRFPALQTLSLDGAVSTRTLAAFLCEFAGVAELRLVNCDADDALGLLACQGPGEGPRRVMVHRVRDAAALDGLYSRGVAVQVHSARWLRLSHWPEGLDDHADADDLFMQLRAR
ncbi:hypothetical protein C8R44DRAFT_734291 [Mycena epipterygia]|nr:hypothetical protein C8R44DRAFT_734291 [Mycena epipterygia]